MCVCVCVSVCVCVCVKCVYYLMIIYPARAALSCQGPLIHVCAPVRLTHPLPPLSRSQVAWVAKGSAELCSLAFYTTVGYKFRPHPENPYLRVHSDDEEEAEGSGAGGAEGRSMAVLGGGGGHGAAGPDGA